MKTSRLELLGESSDSGRELPAGVVSEEERSEIEEAIEFLRAELADGARHQAAEIYGEASKLGIGDRKLRRARKKLRARTEKAGSGAAGSGGYRKQMRLAMHTSAGRLRPSPLRPLEFRERTKG